MARSGAALLLLLLLLYCCGAIEVYQDTTDSRKLFGGYRIVPKPCRPESDTLSAELGICMFNYECSAREGEVVGSCMDGFLFGACCRLPPGHTFQLPDSDLLSDNTATFPPDNPNSIVATSKRPSYMESSSISELLNNPQLHVSAHPDADTVLITGPDRPMAVATQQSSETTLRPELSTFSYVQSNSVDEEPSTPKYHLEEKSTMSVTPTYYSTASKWASSFRPRPTPSHEYNEGLVLVPTITKRPDSGPNPESINHIISMLNDTSGGLVDPGPEPEPEIVSLDSSSPAGLSTWVAVNGKPSPSTSWKPDTIYSKTPSSYTTLRPGFSSSSTSSHHVVGPSYDVITTQQGTSRPAPTVIVLGPLSTDITTTTSSSKRPTIITTSNKISTTAPTLVTKRPSTAKPSTGFFITKRPSSTTSTIITKRPSSTQSTNRPTTQHSDRPTAQFTFRPTLSVAHFTNQPSTVPTYFTHQLGSGTSSFTIRPTAGSTQVTSRPGIDTVYVTNYPGLTNRPTSGTTLVSNRPWVTTPIDYPETTLGLDQLANFPPVRNPSFNMTQHERPPVVLPPNPEDLFNVDDIPTPLFVEDDKLDNKLQTFVDKIVLSLDGNFQDLEEVLYSGKNVTTTRVTTTRRPSTSKRPVQATPTRKPTVSVSTPTRRPSTSQATQTQTLRPQPTRPSQTTRPRPSSNTRPSSVRPLQTTRPSIRPTQTSRPTLHSTRPSQTPRPRPTSIKPTQSSKPSSQRPSTLKPSSQRPSRPSTTYRPASTVKVTTKRSTTTSSTTQLLQQEDETVPSKTTTTEESTTLLDYTLTTAVDNDDELTTTPSPVDYKHECGVRPLMQKSGRIVGGKGATFGEWPWQVLVRESTWLGLFTKNKCGGVLITSRYVITAAHCQPGFLANLVAVFGEFDISGELESRRSVTKNIRRVIVHRQYDAATFANDLALLELESPVAFDEHIVPICMPRDKEDFTGRMATVTGWGRLKYGGGVPNLLQEVQVPVIENSVCQEMFHTAGHSKVILNSFLCAGYANGQKDSCEGDSGGPLMLQREDGHWVLVGTVSHGIKCAAPYLPGVYMRTTFYKPWLHAITGVK
ncbi:hypothetical protein B7P43_G10805 [Cryptotermes secundus]|uniref:Peptidase S1 domain-containing protein n=1 Tax=Cryptotermes secundus TaxID=105785 RepID=A0A2J7RRK4_9NEOP|nr:serine protease filzig [Cryptotermes secundus]PNF43463.1 hypothetical protein B7P43_G10805 [Cryptotermes secundus]